MNAGRNGIWNSPSLERILSYYCMDAINVLLLLFAVFVGSDQRRKRARFFVVVMII